MIAIPEWREAVNQGEEILLLLGRIQGRLDAISADLTEMRQMLTRIEVSFAHIIAAPSLQ